LQGSYAEHLKQAKAETTRVVEAVRSVACKEKTVAAVTPPTPPTGGSNAVVTPPTPPKTSPCDTMDVEDVKHQAQLQYVAGYAKSALTLLNKALGCKTDSRMFQLATMYACRAHAQDEARSGTRSCRRKISRWPSSGASKRHSLLNGPVAVPGRIRSGKSLVPPVV
jgi:hypothetical protein